MAKSSEKEVSGGVGLYKLISKTYDQKNDSKITTRAYQIGGIGCQVQTVVKYKKSVAVSTEFIAGVVLVEDTETGYTKIVGSGEKYKYDKGVE